MFAYQQTKLGQDTDYSSLYDPKLLCPLPRLQGRKELDIDDVLPFDGVDIWHNYEASWLNGKGKPQVAIVQLIIPCSSPYLIESKSLKLYFNSLNFMKFDSQKDYIKLVQQDLSTAAGVAIKVIVLPVEQAYQLNALLGVCLDEIDIDCQNYDISPQLLSCVNPPQTVTESLYSHLLRSNCPVTNQPDWGSVKVTYTGVAIEHASLLRYLISFRQHNDFHEQCVERIFSDIMRICQPQKLTVQAFYTRRGGLDINPYRSNFESFSVFNRLARQ